MKKKYKAMVLTCIDPRCQPKINTLMKKKKLTGEYSLFSIAGSTLGITSKNFKNWEKVFWKNFLISSQIHGIKKLIVINHYDCSFAKMINKKKFFNNKIEKEIHVKSFRLLKKRFLKRYPKFKLETKIISV
ncbi:MAG: carbonic anhydrase [Pelagibacteraceae bacterium]